MASCPFCCCCRASLGNSWATAEQEVGSVELIPWTFRDGGECLPVRTRGVRALRWASRAGGVGAVMAAVVSQGQRRRRVQGGRTARVVVRFTVEELAAVSGRAVAAGLTVPSYLALAGLRPEGVEAADAKSALTNLVGVRRVLAGVASNLNQLTVRRTPPASSTRRCRRCLTRWSGWWPEVTALSSRSRSWWPGHAGDLQRVAREADGRPGAVPVWPGPARGAHPAADRRRLRPDLGGGVPTGCRDVAAADRRAGRPDGPFR